MEEQLGPLQAIGRFWGALNSSQRFITAVFISVSIALLAIVSLVATKPKMDVLFSGLQPSDSGAIVAKLQENKVPYQVEGNAIKVPQKYVAEMRMQLAGQGLPQGGTVGFEIFDKNSLGMTEFSQRVRYLTALQGELSRTINQLDRVSASRVHITIPKESLFSSEKNQAKASVTIQVRPGDRLSSEQVGGIVHLVASAVEGLNANQVSVVDTNGNLLAAANDGATGLDPNLSASQMKLKKGYEQQMEKDIQSMLERVLGPSKAVVRVNADLNFDRTETSSETYVPAAEGSVLVSEEKLDENYGQGTGTVGGPVGVGPNSIPNAGEANTTTASGKGAYSRTETTSKYEVSKTTEHVIKAPGQVKKLSVAVMVDSKAKTDVATIERAVRAASGVDDNRGDVVTVQNVEFDTSTLEQEVKEMKTMSRNENLLGIGKTVGAILLLFGFLFFLKGMLKNVNVSLPAPVIVQEVTGGTMPNGGQSYQGPMPGMGGASTANAAQMQPEDVAQVVRNWMSES